MIELKISGYGEFRIKYIVFDLNGTLAVDGSISDNIRQNIRELARKLTIIIASSDIHGNLHILASSLEVKHEKLTPGATAQQKLALVRRLGRSSTIAIGNGINDADMLEEAAIGIGVIGPEGASTKALLSADLIVNDISDALECIMKPLRIIGTLRD